MTTEKHHELLVLQGKRLCVSGYQKFPLCAQGTKLFIESCSLIESQRGGDFSRSLGSYHTDICWKCV